MSTTIMSSLPQQQEQQQHNIAFEILRMGDGPQPSVGKTATMHYTAKFESFDGQQFDSTHKKQKPYGFVVGVSRVIKGWEVMVGEMCVGEVRRFVLPPHLAYGEEGIPGVIPSNKTLYFEVELLSVQ